MKKTGIIIALVSLTATGFAQARNCACKTKTVKQKVVKKTVAAPKPEEEWTRTYTYTRKPEEPCFRYRKHNIVVTECPGTFYDNSDFNGMSSEGTYMGNYPSKKLDRIRVDGAIAPQRNTSENDVVAPAGGNTFNTGHPPVEKK